MKTHISFLFTALFISIFLITGCNLTRLTTNQKAGDLRTFEKAFIIINNYNESRFYRNLVTELRKELLSNTISSEILTIDELSLKTEEDIAQQIAAFSPQVVIEFKELSKVSSTILLPNTYIPIERNDGRVCIIEMRDYQTNEILWKGKLVTDEYLQKKQAARKSIRKLFEAFESGSLISMR